MNSIKQPNFIIFGKNSIDEFNFPTNCLVITSKGAKPRGWLEHFKSKNYYIFDKDIPAAMPIASSSLVVIRIFFFFKPCEIKYFMVESGTPIKFLIPLRNNKSNIRRCDNSFNFHNLSYSLTVAYS